MPVQMVSDHVLLRQLAIADTDTYYAWVKDPEVVKYSLSKWLKRYTKAEIEAWLRKTLADENTLNWGIVEKTSKNLIGHAGIAGIHKGNNSGEYFILIGDRNSWNKGYGTEVTKLIVDYGFKELKLHRIMLTVSDVNIGAVKSYKKAGFVEEGVMREASMRDGKFHDKIVMAILDREWEG